MAYVLLVNPNKVRYPSDEGDISGGELSPPLGLMLLGAVLREKGHQVRIFDRQTTKGDSNLSRELDEYAKTLAEGGTPDFVGITCVTPFRYDAKHFIAKTREVLPHAKIVVGGPDATFATRQYLAPGCADLAVLGEGELTLSTLVEGVEPSRIPGIAYIKKGNISRTGMPDMVDLDEMPFAARDLIKLDRYPKETASMISSRGCPYHCVFCCSGEFWGIKFRTYSPKRLADEIELLYREFKYNRIRHHDDNWAYRSEAFISDLRDELVSRDLTDRITHEVETSPVTIDERKITLLQEIGVDTVWISMETAQPHLLKYLKKPYSIEQVERAVELLRQAHFSVGLYVIFGIPDETYEQAIETVDKLCALEPAYVGASILTAYPGTALYNTVPPGQDLRELFGPLAGWAHWGNYLGQNMSDYELLKVFAYAYHKLGNKLGNSYRLRRLFQFGKGLTEIIADADQPWKKRMWEWQQLKRTIKGETKNSTRAALQIVYEDLRQQIIKERPETPFTEHVKNEQRIDVIQRGQSESATDTVKFLDVREEAYRNLMARVANIPYFAQVRPKLIAYRDAVVKGDENKQLDLFKEIVSSLWPQSKGRDDVMDIFAGGRKSEWLLTGLGHRRHFLHQFQVFLTGSYIIAGLQDSMARSAEAARLGLTSESLYCTWLMASVLHDVGLSIVMRREMKTKLELIDEDFRLEQTSELQEPRMEYDHLRKAQVKTGNGGVETIDLVNLLQSWFDKNDILKKGIIESEFAKGDHGILGALVILRTLLPFLQEVHDVTAKASTLLIEEETELGNAVAAIAVHSLQPEYFSKQVSFKVYPALFLLRLIDELDEEKRVTGDSEDRHDLYLSSIGQRIENSEKEIELVLAPWARAIDDTTVDKEAIEERVRRQCEEARKWLRLPHLAASELSGCTHSVSVVAILALKEPCELVRMPVIKRKKPSSPS